MPNTTLIARCLLVLLATATLPLGAQTSAPLGPQPSANPTSIQRFRAGGFEVIATTSRPTVRIRDVGNALQNLTARMFNQLPSDFPTPTLRLAPPGLGGLAPEEPYRIYAESRGVVGVVIRWEESTAFATFCDALAEAWLSQIATYRRQSEQPVKVPDFLSRGLSLHLQVSLRPASRLFLQELGKQTKLIPLPELFIPTSAEANTIDYRVNAFWLIELINLNLGRPSVIREYYEGILAGSPPLESLQNFAPALRRDDPQLSIWWSVGYNELVHQDLSPVETRRESIARLARFSKFDLIVEGQAQPVNLRDVAQYIDTDEVRRLVQMRLRELQQSLPRVHPVFQNASRALAVVLQSTLDGDEKTRDEAITALQSQWTAATRISATIDATISSR